MKTHIYHRFDCREAKGLCVIVDVIKAFTTAAFAFNSGASAIYLASCAQEAINNHKKNPSFILIGEDEGQMIQGFDYGNSPREFQKAQFSKRQIIQRTTSGTQGVHACPFAEQMLIASFVVAEATYRYIIQQAPTDISFIVTGRNDGDEDLALAEYLQAKILKNDLSIDPYIARVENSKAAKRMLALDEFGTEDLKLISDHDRFSFAMVVNKISGNFIAQKKEMVLK